MDLVHDVDLLAARGTERGPGDQVAHGLHPVVGGGIELVDVERGSLGDLEAGGADPAGLTVARSVQLRALARIRAVEVLPVPRGPLNR